MSRRNWPRLGGEIRGTAACPGWEAEGGWAARNGGGIERRRSLGRGDAEGRFEMTRDIRPSGSWRDDVPNVTLTSTIHFAETCFGCSRRDDLVRAQKQASIVVVTPYACSETVVCKHYRKYARAFQRFCSFFCFSVSFLSSFLSFSSCSFSFFFLLFFLFVFTCFNALPRLAAGVKALGAVLSRTR